MMRRQDDGTPGAGLGARVIGKTNLHELSAGITANNATFGRCATRTTRR